MTKQLTPFRRGAADTERCDDCGFMKRYHVSDGECPDLVFGIPQRERVSARHHLRQRAERQATAQGGEQ